MKMQTESITHTMPLSGLTAFWENHGKIKTAEQCFGNTQDTDGRGEASAKMEPSEINGAIRQDCPNLNLTHGIR